VPDVVIELKSDAIETYEIDAQPQLDPVNHVLNLLLRASSFELF
jgi:hypothetical protein